MCPEKIEEMYNRMLDVAKKRLELEKLKIWTEMHYAEKISICDAAAVLGYSKSYFCTYFKKLTGDTYGTYLKTIRIEHACRLLLTGMPVEQVSSKVGFESTSYFFTLFKAINGVTPGKYISKTNH